ncbi:MAG TPA: cytidine deaminase [Panacibacter sp.]|nr:cytidine deaminase [Panacibacter sp.]HNP45639.1 cytidine deaminase [Panacibacter sp.]
MGAETYSFAFEVYHNSDALIDADRTLLDAARQATANAYAPYSKFLVAAAARLDSGEIICGTNQENASYPAGICAERVLLSAIASQHRGAVITTIAISYQNQNGPSEKPISPCGICRQSLLEYEERQQHSIRLILGALEGEVYSISNTGCLLPLAFRGDHLKTQ